MGPSPLLFLLKRTDVILEQRPGVGEGNKQLTCFLHRPLHCPASPPVHACALHSVALLPSCLPACRVAVLLMHPCVKPIYICERVDLPRYATVMCCTVLSTCPANNRLLEPLATLHTSDPRASFFSCLSFGCRCICSLVCRGDFCSYVGGRGTCCHRSSTDSPTVLAQCPLARQRPLTLGVFPLSTFLRRRGPRLFVLVQGAIRSFFISSIHIISQDQRLSPSHTVALALARRRLSALQTSVLHYHQIETRADSSK
ncbi:hypothetical protein BCV70DRAFT_56833 [Testicularia cyperi]|uniref:Uncharacterized protein n=1 Tax=Testicularia cyperi TaxID=1882483 RepID=A0A317XUQ1_9BASI|nr:hypothetical protein BCV70DRAFT_56833 [Testicularia cyperi]